MKLYFFSLNPFFSEENVKDNIVTHGEWWTDGQGHATLLYRKESRKKVFFFSGMANKALPPSPLELSGKRNFF